MSKADNLFISMCKDIIEHGTTTQGEKVRPHWEDGTSAYTIKKFGVCNRYDLREEFPALTLRRTALKSAMDEILWIYQKSQTIFMTCIRIFGIHGPMKLDRLEKHTGIKLALKTTIPKVIWIKWIKSYMTLNIIHIHDVL